MSDVAKPRLKPASENPWYCLATLYGEQRGDGIDGDLAEKNRVGWDRWVGSAGGGMTEELHTELLKKPFMARMGIRAALPDPSQPVDFTYTCFENPFVFSGFQCPREVDFSWAEFLNYADFGRAQFRQQAIFRSATFSKNANFATAIFSDVADFNSGTFLESADLSRTYFEGANFSSASFSKKVTLVFPPDHFSIGGVLCNCFLQFGDILRSRRLQLDSFFRKRLLRFGEVPQSD
jgi:Pentapeptide repeats (8 copies)